MTKEVRAPQTLQEAFEILDLKDEFRFAAIHFLFNHSHTKELEDKIVSSLTRVYEDPSGRLVDYVLVAENHLTPRLIEPVVNIFTRSSIDSWDLLEDEANYLLQKLASAYPDEMLEKGIPIINKAIEENTDADYFFTFDMFRFLNKKKCTPWFIATMQKRFVLNDAFIQQVMQLNIPETIPYVRKALDEYTSNYWDSDDVNIEELEENFLLLKNGTISQTHPSILETRGRWEEFYLGVEKYVLSNEEISELCKLPRPYYMIHETRSNNECYCGKQNKSGRIYKYRNCCFAKDAKLVNLPHFTKIKTKFLPN